MRIRAMRIGCGHTQFSSNAHWMRIECLVWTGLKCTMVRTDWMSAVISTLHWSTIFSEKVFSNHQITILVRVFQDECQIRHHIFSSYRNYKGLAVLSPVNHFFIYSRLDMVLLSDMNLGYLLQRFIGARIMKDALQESYTRIMSNHVRIMHSNILITRNTQETHMKLLS